MPREVIEIAGEPIEFNFIDEDDLSNQVRQAASFSESGAAQPTEQVGQLETGAQGLLSGATLGFNDEIEGFLGAIGAKGSDLLTGVIGGDKLFDDVEFGELYKQGRDTVRRRQALGAEQNPVTSIAGEVVGSVATGGAALKGAQALTKPLISVAPKLAKAAQVVGIGGAAGAGFSEQEDIGGIVNDAVQSGAISFGFASALNVLSKTPAARKRIKEILSSKSSDKFTRAEEFVRKHLSPSQAKQLQDSIVDAEKAGISKSLIASVKSEEVLRKGNVLARGVGTADIAKKGVDSIAKTLSRQESKLISKIAPDVVTAQEGAELFKQGVTSIRDNLVEGMRVKAKPLFDAANKATLTDKQVGNLVQNPTIRNALGKAEAKFKSVVKRTSNNSFERFKLAKEQLDDEISTALRSGENKFVALELLPAKKELVSKLSSISPVYAQGIKTFADDAMALEKVLGTARKPTTLGKVINLMEKDSVKGVAELMKQEPELIAKNRKLLQAFGMQDAFDAGVKGFIVDSIEKSARSGANISNQFRSPKARRQLISAIGKEKSRGLLDVFDELDNLQALKNSVTGQSGTESLLAARADLATAGVGKTKGAIIKGTGMLGHITEFVKSPVLNAGKIITTLGDEKFNQEVTKILFDRKRGKQFLTKIAAAKTDGQRSSVVGQLFAGAVDSVIDINKSIAKGTGTTALGIAQSNRGEQ